MDAQDLGKKTQEWLGDEGYTVEVSRKAGYSSYFTAFRPEKREYSVTIAQLANSDSITLSTGVTLGDSEKNRIKSSPQEARRELLSGLTNLLYSRPCIFGIDEADDSLKGVTISASIYADGFTKDRLMSEMRSILSTQMLVVHHLGDFFSNLSAAEFAQSRPGPETASPATRTFCPNCGRPTSPGQKFCRSCGQPLQTQRTEQSK